MRSGSTVQAIVSLDANLNSYPYSTFQVGLLATIGLSAKNAILIVEFAVDGERRGLKAKEAALEAARLRLRPILMTSIAFIAGVFPLAVASGAGWFLAAVFAVAAAGFAVDTGVMDWPRAGAYKNEMKARSANKGKLFRRINAVMMNMGCFLDRCGRPGPRFFRRRNARGHKKALAHSAGSDEG